MLNARGHSSAVVRSPEAVQDDRAASDLLDTKAGTWVALGGGAPHLKEAVIRLRRVAGVGAGRWGRRGAAVGDEAAAGRPKALRGYADLMP